MVVNVNWPVIAGAVLLIGGIIVVIVSIVFPRMRSWFRKPTHPQAGNQDFIDRVSSILLAAKNAPPEVQVDYLKKGLAQEAVLWLEVERLHGLIE